MNYTQLVPMNKSRRKVELYQEELQSRLEIQSQALRNYNKEIYENIAQVLCLARIQIMGLETGIPVEQVQASSSLVAQAIDGLRRLSRQASPEVIVQQGFAAALQQEYLRYSAAGNCELPIKVSGFFYSLEDAKELALFNFIQQLLACVSTLGFNFRIQTRIKYGKTSLQLQLQADFTWSGCLVNEDNLQKWSHRLRLIDGSIRYQPRKEIITITINR